MPDSSPHPVSRRVLGLERGTAAAYLALFLLAFAFYAAIWRNAPLPSVDTPKYVDAARDLSDFHIDQLQYRTPGYPLLLLATGSADHAGRLLFYVALLLHFSAVWMIGTVLHALGFGRQVLIIIALALLLPPFVENAAYILSENLTQFTLVAGCAGLFHWSRTRRTAPLVLSAIAFAYAGLTRPTYQAVAIAVAVSSVVCGRISAESRRGAARALAALVLASVLLVGGYSFVNYARFGYFGVTPMLGFHLGSKTLRVLERIPDRDAAVRAVLIKHRDAHLVRPNSSHTGYMYIWSAIPDLEEATGMDTADLSRYMLRVHLRLIAAAPLEYLMEVGRAAVSYWSPSVTSVASLGSRSLQLLWSLAQFLLFAAFAVQGVLLTGSTLHLAVRWRRRGALVDAIGWRPLELLAYALAATLILYTMLVSVLVESGVSRVRTPADIFLFLMLPIGFRVWFRQARQAGRSAGNDIPVARAAASCASSPMEQLVR